MNASQQATQILSNFKAVHGAGENCFGVTLGNQFGVSYDWDRRATFIEVVGEPTKMIVWTTCNKEHRNQVHAMYPIAVARKLYADLKAAGFQEV